MPGDYSLLIWLTQWSEQEISSQNFERLLPSSFFQALIAQVRASPIYWLSPRARYHVNFFIIIEFEAFLNELSGNWITPRSSKCDSRAFSGSSPIGIYGGRISFEFIPASNRITSSYLNLLQSCWNTGKGALTFFRTTNVRHPPSLTLLRPWLRDPDLHQPGGKSIADVSLSLRVCLPLAIRTARGT